MPTVHINGIPYEAEAGETLSACLWRAGLAVEHPCGGRGACKKCTVTVNGHPALSCQYRIAGGETVETQAVDAIATEVGSAVGTATESAQSGRLVLDIGTTTLALALTDPSTGAIRRAVTANNPQRTFGADIISRISYASLHGVEDLTHVLREAINRLIARLEVPVLPLYAAGNTTMLHLLLGVDPTPMGTAPYTPAFLDEKRLSPDACGLVGVSSVTILPGLAAFVGADLVAGVHHVGLPTSGHWRLLVDLGTNAEILLFSRDRLLCTAAAAGPCFEGACISSGMSATAGAICAYDADGGYETIENASPKGVCGTGLVDAVAALLDNGIVDETGYMECPAFYLCEGVSLSREDIRQYQLAKAAVHAGILALVARAGIRMDDMEQVYIAGGFATRLRVDTAVRTGLLPRALSDRITAVGNSCLSGTARWASDPVDLGIYTRMAEYVDLSSDAVFTEAFMEQMMFE